MAGYTRQSTFADGDTITAALFNNEYNQLFNAFNNTGGHKHDGTANEGPVIGLIGDAGETSPNNKVLIDTTNNFIEFYVQVSSSSVQQLYIADGAIIPVTDSDVDLGTSSLYFKNAYIDSITTTGNVAVGGNLTVTGTTTFNGGTITMGDAATDNVVFGADVDSHIIPDDDNTYDLGSSTQEWRNLYIDGTAHIDTLDVDANATVAGTLGVTGVLTGTSLDISGDIDVDGTTNLDVVDIDGAVDMATTLTVAGNVDFNGDLDVDGTTNLDVVDIDGAVDMASTLTLAGNADFNGDLDVDGTTNLDVVDIDGAVDMATTLTVGGEITAASLDISGNVDIDGTLETDALSINSTTVTSTAAELNILDGVTSTAAELNILDGVTSTTAELNILDGVTATATEINLLDGVTSTTAELNILDGVTATAAEINTLDGITSTVAELNILDGVTASATDINLIDGITNGTVIASKAIVTDANKDITGGRNITITGELDAATLDISGNADIDGTLEADAITIGGVTLAETISDTVGAMVTSNTESGITVAYQDADNTLDFTVGTLNQDTTGNSATATALETARTIHGVSFDGTGNIDLSEVVQDTVGAMFTSNSETGIVAAYQDSDGTIDLAVGTLNQDTTGLAATATALATARTIHGVSFDGTANIDLTEVVQDTVGAMVSSNTESGITVAYQDGDGTLDFTVGTLNQDTTGSAATLTTARTIGGVSFDGSANINLPGVNTSGNQNTTGNAATATLAATTTVTNSTANTNFPIVFHNESNGLLDDTGALRYNPSTGELLVPKLTVAGTTTQVDTVTMEASNAIIFEGATADAHETTLSVIDPTADRTISLPNATGTLSLITGTETLTNKTLTAPTLTGTATVASLDISGDIDVDGTTNLDVVDIDGAVDMASTLNVSGAITGTLGTAAQTNITSLGTLTTLTVDDITINGSTISDGGSLTLDVGGDIILDADGGEIKIGDDGVKAEISFPSNSLQFYSSTSDADIIFKGNDGGSAITALTLDMSDAGRATFNNKASFNNPIAVGQSTFSGGSVLADFHGSGSGVGAQLAFANDHNTSKFFVGIEGNTSGDGFLYQQQNADINFYTNNTLHAKLHNDGAFVTTPTAGGHAVFNENSVDADFRVESNGNSNMLFVDGGNDRVGVGINNPTRTFEVNSGSTNAVARFESTDSRASLEFKDSAGTAALGCVGNHLSFLPANSERMVLNDEGGLVVTPTTGGHAVFNEGSVDADFRVESNGNTHMLFVDGGNDRVGIGRSAPGTIFEVHMSTNKNIGYSDGQGELGSIPALVAYQDNGSLTDIGFRGTTVRFASTNQERMRIDETGVVANEGSHDADFRVESNNNAAMLFVDGGNDRVGIGTNAPTDPLTIHDGTPSIKFKDTSSNGEAFWTLDGTSMSFFNKSTGGYMAFGTANTERMKLLGTGNLSLALGVPLQATADGRAVNASVGTSFVTILDFSTIGGTNAGTGFYLVTVVREGASVGTSITLQVGVSSSGLVIIYDTLQATGLSAQASNAQIQVKQPSGSAVECHATAIPMSVTGHDS